MSCIKGQGIQLLPCKDYDSMQSCIISMSIAMSNYLSSSSKPLVTSARKPVSLAASTKTFSEIPKSDFGNCIPPSPNQRRFLRYSMHQHSKILKIKSIQLQYLRISYTNTDKGHRKSQERTIVTHIVGIRRTACTSWSTRS